MAPRRFESAISTAPRTRAWTFSSVASERTAAEHRRQHVEIGLEHRVDRNDLVTDAERARERFRVSHAVIGRIPRGHGHTEHVGRPERLGRERGRQRGVHATRQSDDGARETAFSRVVAEAQHERADTPTPRPSRPRVAESAAALGAPGNGTSIVMTSSSNSAPRRIVEPSGAMPIEWPSNTSSSLPPTWLT